jgi:tRNA G18 (ribose-2'-O)-methylase SpoU
VSEAPHTVAIESARDPRVAGYRDVREADLRAAEGLFVVEGRLNVKRLLCGSRFRPRSVFVSRAALAALRTPLARFPGPVFVAEPALLAEVVGYDMHRGCLALAERAPVESLESVLARERDARGAHLWLGLDGVANPENVGGGFRNALAFGADRVLVGPRCADPLYRKSVRVSMGASLRLPFASTDGLERAAAALRAAGFCVVALCTARDALPLHDFSPAGRRVALFVGPEDAGLPAGALAAADLRLTIPMAGGVDSLNVATAAGIALCQLGRQLGRVADGA